MAAAAAARRDRFGSGLEQRDEENSDIIYILYTYIIIYTRKIGGSMRCTKKLTQGLSLMDAEKETVYPLDPFGI